VIRTTYEISVDRMHLMQHVVVTAEGQVQCHALPNYTFLFAIDLVKSLIDQFPEDFKRSGTRPHPMSGMSTAPGHLRKSKTARKPSKREATVRQKMDRSVPKKCTARPSVAQGPSVT